MSEVDSKRVDCGLGRVVIVLPVCLQDAKKSRLPVLIKPSQSLGGVCRLPASQEAVAHLQAQVLKLQGELKELKIRNKQLHQKLILAETMTEGRPAPEEVLPKGKHQGKRVLRGKMDGLTARPDMAAVVFGIRLEDKFPELL